MAQSFTTPTTPALGAGSVRSWCIAFAIVSFGTALSLVMSGYIGGWGNNYYHLPILAGLYNEPQFSGDMFIQSLRFYSSGFWQVLSDRVHGRDVYWILFLFQILSRMLLFAGMLAWADLLGIKASKEQLVFVTLIALSSILQGFAKAGAGGLLIDGFTQSELANSTTLFALAWAARGRITAAFVMNGLTFFLNAFVAVWTVVPLLFIICTQWRQGRWTLRSLSKPAALGLAGAAFLAAPVVYNIMTNPYTEATPAFGYIDYLKAFYPYHFLVSSLPLQDLWQFAVIFLCGAIASSMLRQPQSYLIPALCGAVVVWVIGTFLPALTDARMLLNLHLLRSGTTVHLLCAIGIAALTTRWTFSSAESDRHVWAPAMVALSCTFKTMLIPLLLVLGIRSLWPVVKTPWRYYAAPAFLAAAALFIAVHIYGIAVWERNALNSRNDWEALAEWAQTNTPLKAVFLMPPGISRGTGQMLPPSNEDQDRLFEGSEVFPYFSHRQSWVFTPSGAAVMWAPAYYWTWRNRLTEVRNLKNLPDRLNYAARQGISYVVDGCLQSSPQAPVAQFGNLCVFKPSESTPS
ncbi:hypothetical protein ACMDCR_28105 [Labrys okinawensis]|uniref:hypothetical protein n=1 Tax=Labrys okinawensis TaxID=346911 RepID=UPI0039BD42A6